MRETARPDSMSSRSRRGQRSLEGVKRRSTKRLPQAQRPMPSPSLASAPLISGVPRSNRTEAINVSIRPRTSPSQGPRRHPPATQIRSTADHSPSRYRRRAMSTSTRAQIHSVVVPSRPTGRSIGRRSRSLSPARKRPDRTEVASTGPVILGSAWPAGAGRRLPRVSRRGDREQPSVTGAAASRRSVSVRVARRGWFERPARSWSPAGSPARARRWRGPVRSQAARRSREQTANVIAVNGSDSRYWIGSTQRLTRPNSMATHSDVPTPACTRRRTPRRPRPQRQSPTRSPKPVESSSNGHL